MATKKNCELIHTVVNISKKLREKFKRKYIKSWESYILILWAFYTSERRSIKSDSDIAASVCFVEQNWEKWKIINISQVMEQSRHKYVDESPKPNSHEPIWEKKLNTNKNVWRKIWNRNSWLCFGHMNFQEISFFTARLINFHICIYFFCFWCRLTWIVRCCR